MKEVRQYSEEECNYSIKIGMVGGFIAGWAIGIALLLYAETLAVPQWSWEPSIPIWNGIGWMLYGMIGGSGGVFADFKFSPKVEHKLNQVLHLAERRAA